jgi:hypothetical protein
MAAGDSPAATRFDGRERTNRSCGDQIEFPSNESAQQRVPRASSGSNQRG